MTGFAPSPPRLPALSGIACGLAILLWPGTPAIVRVLGLAGIVLWALAALAPSRALARGGAAAPPATATPASASASGPDSGALSSPSAATPRDMATAMQLLGSAIVDQVDTSVRTVLDENHNMREVAREMSAAADQAKGQFNHSMQKATEAEGSIEALQSFSGDLVASIQVIGGAVKTSIDIVSRATVQAADTRGCVETMATLSASVAAVVRLIDDIAGKTRMLALNATIESARAGEAGRGFAVVAGEVKDLAQQTAAATAQIGAKIREMTAMVDRSVAALQTLVATIESVDSSSASIGQAITEQEILANRVSSSLTDMRASVFTLSREIREAAQIAANSGMLSDLVLETANSVDGLMSGLNDKLRTIGEGMIPVSTDVQEVPDRAAIAS